MPDTRRKPRREIPIFRIRVRKHFRLTPPRDWAPLSEAEWSELGGLLGHLECGFTFDRRRRGRPIEDVRARLDAIFRAVTLKNPEGGRGFWHQLPDSFGNPGTVNRTWRRWGHRGLWERLLIEAAAPYATPTLRALAYWICCAFRRLAGRMSLRQILLVRHLGLITALPGPLWACPEPILSASLAAWVEACRKALLTAPAGPEIEPDLQAMARGLLLAGRAMRAKQFRRAWEPA